MSFARPRRALFRLSVVSAAGITLAALGGAVDGQALASTPPPPAPTLAKHVPTGATTGTFHAANPKPVNDSVIVTRDSSTSQSTIFSTVNSSVAPMGLKAQTSLPMIKSVALQVPAAKAQAVAAALRKEKGVLRVEVDAPRQLFDVTPDDPGYTNQSAYLGDYGTTGGVSAPAGWAENEGSSAVKIAVIDTGIDVNHPDLSSKIVDPYNAVDSIAGTSDMTDDVGHGTFVAGVAAADTDNGVGVAGAGFNTDIMPIKIADTNDQLDPAAELNAISWAITNHANVINMSFGGTTFSQDEENAIESAEQAGIVVVAAAGNYGGLGDPISYPAGYPGVIAVGATDAQGHRAEFSEYGSWVSVAAPGVNIYSTTPTSESTDFQNVNYDTGSGTSFSAPIVAGEAALLANTSPTPTAAQIRAAIIDSANGYAGLGLGTGQVNFANAFNHLAPQTTPTITAPESGMQVSGNVTLTASSTAPAVQFYVNSSKIGGPVPVIGRTPTSSGTATTTWASWGNANTSFTISAQDCTATNECGAKTAGFAVTLANNAPTVTSPVASSSMNGIVTLGATSAGGGVEFLIDGKKVAFTSTSPYAAVTTTNALTGTSHSITAVQCNLSGSVCSGPTSAAVSATSVKPLSLTVGGFSPSPFSPNGDGVKDTTSATVTVPSAMGAQLSVYSSAGVIVKALSGLGAYGAGSHTATWNGTATNGSRVADGTYTVVIDTYASGTSAKGAQIQTVRVDDTPPSLTNPVGAGTTFYPVVDGYKDTFSPGITLSEFGTLTLYIETSGGSIVREITGTRGAGTTSATWNGTNTSNKIVSAGTYKWFFKETDGAGNVKYSPAAYVAVNLAKLVQKTATGFQYGKQAQGFFTEPGTPANCSFYDPSSDQAYPNGVELFNTCTRSVDGFAASGGGYEITVSAPGAIKYTSIGITATGLSFNQDATIAAGLVEVDSAGGTNGIVDFPGIAKGHFPGYSGVRVTSTSTGTYNLGVLGGSFHLTSANQLFLEIFSSDADDIGQPTDFDLDYVKVTVNYDVLS